jgi:hypothetical protein
MKKFVVLSLISFLILAFGATVYGQEKAPALEFKASGFIDAVSLLYRNVAPAAGPIFGPPSAATGIGFGGDAFDRTNNGMSTRGHLKFDAMYGKEITGTIYFEMDASRWGDNGFPATSGGKAGRWTGDETAVEIKNLYFTFGIPAFGAPWPMTVSAGIQPLSIRPKVFVYTDGGGLIFNTKIDPAIISLYYFKAIEGEDWSADDADIYGIHANSKFGALTAGLYGFYYHMKDYPLQTGTTLRAAAITYPDASADMYWFGLYADGKVGPVLLNLDFVYDYGKVEDRRQAVVRFSDVDYRGWVVRAKVDYPWEKFNFGFVGMYASGADAQETGATGLPSATADKVESYVVPPGSENFAFGDSIVLQTEWNRALTGFRTSSGSSVNRGCLGGTWIAQLYGSIMATPWWKATLKVMYIGDTTDNGNTIGNAVRADDTPRDDSTIGWEVDLINEISIYKNLKWDIALGWISATDGLEYRSGVGTNENGKDPYIFLTRLVYTF